MSRDNDANGDDLSLCSRQPEGAFCWNSLASSFRSEDSKSRHLCSSPLGSPVTSSRNCSLSATFIRIFRQSIDVSHEFRERVGWHHSTIVRSVVATLPRLIAVLRGWRCKVIP